jgi:molecular chaperone GrpE
MASDNNKPKEEHIDKDESVQYEPDNEAGTQYQEDDEVVPEEESESRDLVKKLREKLKKVTEEKQAYLDGWQRSKAEYINARKRDEESKKEYIRFANEELLQDLIPVLDSFEMAFSNKEAWEKADENWRKGVEYIYSQLTSILEKYNAVAISPLGEEFNPKRDTAVELVAIDDKEKDGKIVAVLQRGYLLNGKVIRSPRVKVGEYKGK